MAFTLPSYSPNVVDPYALIQVYENELQRAQKEVSQYKRFLSLLKKSKSHGVTTEVTDFDLQVSNLKWRKEIRHCLSLWDGFHLSPSNEIAACIAKKNNLPAIDRNIKTKISTTLSLMHKEGEVGRVILKNSRDYMYGIKEYFEDDCKTLKTQYLPTIEYLLEK